MGHLSQESHSRRTWNSTLEGAPEARILYIVFNEKVREEAAARFKGVQIATSHSLARGSEDRARSLATTAQESDVQKQRDSLTESLGKMNWQLTSFGQENQPTAVLNDTSFEEVRWAQFKTPQAQWGPPTSMRFVIEICS
jgi:hypothetical protein